RPPPITQTSYRPLPLSGVALRAELSRAQGELDAVAEGVMALSKSEQKTRADVRIWRRNRCAERQNRAVFIGPAPRARVKRSARRARRCACQLVFSFAG